MRINFRRLRRFLRIVVLRSSARFGQRVVIEQPGVLEAGGVRVAGSIRDLGPLGVFFSAANLPPRHTQATLFGPDHLPVPVRVAWRRSGSDPGAGLSFERRR